jgi:hypothetical protein
MADRMLKYYPWIQTAMLALVLAGFVLWTSRLIEPFWAETVISLCLGIALGKSIFDAMSAWGWHRDDDDDLLDFRAELLETLSTALSPEHLTIISHLPEEIRRRFEMDDPVPLIGLMFTGIYDRELGEAAMAELMELGKAADPLVGAHVFSVLPKLPDGP